MASGLDRPLQVSWVPGATGQMLVTGQHGVIWLVKGGGKPQKVIDLSSRINSHGNEQGLLSIAFDPDFASNHRLFFVYTRADNADVLARATLNPQTLALAGDPQTVLVVAEPYSNHNGGYITFGPDGYLYMGTGDGGSEGDPKRNGQNTSNLLSAILRLDVDHPANGKLYSIPRGNPFPKGGTARPEIYDYGLRNPWRFSFDRHTGDLWIGDVGQATWEEVDLHPHNQPGGLNFGWSLFEGNAAYRKGASRQGLTFPVTVYQHQGNGCSITGGYVYRGSALPWLQGDYVYGDYCTGKIWALHKDGGSWTSQLLLDTGLQISSFGQDPGGELYIVDLQGGIYKLVPAGN